MEKIHEILGVFQEAVIEEMKMIDKDLNFKLECKYLAEQINPSYSYFYGVFKNVEDLYFIPWEDDLLRIREVAHIKDFRPDILSVDEENDFVKIYSNCKQIYSGGNLYICAKHLKIYDEDLIEMHLEDLMDLSDRYWYSNNRAEG
jgi:hypothetical protein